MGYAYRYTKGYYSPLKKCPACRGRLTEDDGILIELATDSGHPYYQKSKLDGAGNLLDPDREVWRGNHCGTCCGHCGELLINLPGVWEDRLEETE